MSILDPLNIPLKGLNLIEASAGTGKTYAISNIYLQLLIEKNLTVEEILVVTFTKAATEELKGRIRGRIVDALRVLSGDPSDDDFLRDFATRITEKEGAQKRLVNALQSFDLAAIFTIHGFCLRMLHNHAFESGSLFDTGLVEDQTEILSEIVDDFWRQTFYTMDPQAFKETTREMGRENLFDLAKKCVSNPLLAVVDGMKDEKDMVVMSVAAGSSIVSLRHQFIEYVHRESARRKQTENVRSYDDLLIDLFRALEGPGGRELAVSIQQRYKSALVDEFQDTDPLQYRIFKSIYSGSNGALFLIGDPKQSIYSFRGADIFSYMEAVTDVDVQYTLDKNWRSSRGLIKAVNTIFGEAKNPFVFDSLVYRPVGQGNQEKTGRLLVDGVQDPSPFKIWLMKRDDSKKNITKGAARELVGRAVADEIVTLLSKGNEGKALLDGRPVHAGDIAILVPTNWGAREMLKILKEAHVPGVIYSSESIFWSREAMEIERILCAVLEPTNESYVKTALATDMMGISGDDLAGFRGDEQIWDSWVEKFESYRLMFLSRGFIVMARTMVTRERIKQRLRAFPDGERRVTNILHCIELLHNASLENQLGPEGLLKWLHEKRTEESASDADEYQMRLETDEKAVKIVTIHKSKGLEYPVVFCPFSWSGAEGGKDDLVVYHDREKANRPTIDIGFPVNEYGRQSMEQERLAELVRLLYVTFTRAKCRCYLAWGPINESETSALAYLLHYKPRNKEKPDLDGLKDFVKGLSDEQMERDISYLVDKSEGAIELSMIRHPSGLIYKPPRPATEMLTYREFSANIERDWRTTSFTAIVSGREQLAELPDRDTAPEEQGPPDRQEPGEPGTQTISIFNFPRGARAGSCLHDILEHVDFNLGSPDEAKRLIVEKLTEYGFPDKWTGTVYGMLADVLSAPIMGKEIPFSLSTLKASDRLHEVEFFAPLQLISAGRLGEIFRSYAGTVIPDRSAGLIQSLGFKPHRGMLRGFIDMVFHYDGRYYLVDWKSNFLGGVEDYRLDKLTSVMEKELYVLQYHIYAVAVHQYLRVRVKNYHYSEHFGGVFYLFLRGICPNRGTGYGIFFDRPEYNLINDLSCLFAGQSIGE